MRWVMAASSTLSRETLQDNDSDIHGCGSSDLQSAEQWWICLLKEKGVAI
jgi:hypothetical protein